MLIIDEFSIKSNFRLCFFAIFRNWYLCLTFNKNSNRGFLLSIISSKSKTITPLILYLCIMYIYCTEFIIFSSLSQCIKKQTNNVSYSRASNWWKTEEVFRKETEQLFQEVIQLSMDILLWFQVYKTQRS